MTNKTISINKQITILELSKDFTRREVADKTGVSFSLVQKIITKNRAFSEKQKDEAIKRLIILENDPIQNYERQATCPHPHLFVKCHHCGLTLSEKDVSKIMAIISKYEPEVYKIRTEQKI